MELPLLLMAVAFILIVVMILPAQNNPPADKPKDSFTAEEQNEVNYLKGQLKKVQEDRQNLQNELDLIKNTQIQLSYDAEKYKEWADKSAQELEKHKTQNLQLRQDLIAREDDLSKELYINVNLSKDLKEKAEQIAALENTLREFKNKNRDLEDQLKAPKGPV